MPLALGGLAGFAGDGGSGLRAFGVALLMTLMARTIAIMTRPALFRTATGPPDLDHFGLCGDSGCGVSGARFRRCGIACFRRDSIAGFGRRRIGFGNRFRRGFDGGLLLRRFHCELPLKLGSGSASTGAGSLASVTDENETSGSKVADGAVTTSSLTGGASSALTATSAVSTAAAGSGATLSATCSSSASATTGDKSRAMWHRPARLPPLPFRLPPHQQAWHQSAPLHSPPLQRQAPQPPPASAAAAGFFSMR